jgi:hypothetical protein
MSSFISLLRLQQRLNERRHLLRNHFGRGAFPLASVYLGAGRACRKGLLGVSELVLIREGLLQAPNARVVSGDGRVITRLRLSDTRQDG